MSYNIKVKKYIDNSIFILSLNKLQKKFKSSLRRPLIQ